MINEYPLFMKGSDVSTKELAANLDSQEMFEFMYAN
jgi:hypothetical protein